MTTTATTNRIFFFLSVFAALAVGSGHTSSAASPQQLLTSAVQEYRAALECNDRDERLNRFHRAELLFAKLVAGGESPSKTIRNADLLVNLGNAALGGERLGPAILAYRRALLIDPDHHRARQNLEHARTLLPDWVPKPEASGLLDSFFGWTHRLASGELQTLTAMAFLVAAALFAASIRWRQTVYRNLAVIPAIVWLLLLGVMVVSASADAGHAAVVIVPEVVARSADSAGAPARLSQPLPSGAEVLAIQRRDEWTRVRLSDGRDAWLPNSAIAVVAE